MGQLFDTIRRLVAEEKYVVGQHAPEKLEERGIMGWQVAAGLDEGKLTRERPDADTNPAVEVKEMLLDGASSRQFGPTCPKAALPSWSQYTEDYVVAVEVEMVVPVDAPSEPCYEAETVNFLKEVQDHAQRGHLDWLKRHGKVYAALGAA